MTVAPAPTEDAIFDAGAYELPIPTTDGRKADRLNVNFSGGLELDRTSEDDLAFINGLSLGDEVTLQVVATVTKKGTTFAPSKDDSPDSTGFGVGLRVHSVEAV